MIKVSILIPIYNVEQYLRQCLDSVINQTLKDIEIICINDGSKDSSPDIINEYAGKDNRIKVINKQNTGYGHSMNQGLKLAQGEYIGIVESDDFAELNTFEVLYNTAKSVEAEIVKSNFFRQVHNYSIFTEIFDRYFDNCFSPITQNPGMFIPRASIWSAIYKHDFLLKNGIYFNETPGASYQDVSFSFKTLASAERVFLIKDAFLHYRMDNPNSSVKSKQKVYCIFDEFNEIEKFLKDRSNIYDIGKYIMSALKYRHCLNNYYRLDDIFKFKFLERMFEEFKQDNSSRYLNNAYWQEEKWKEVQLLLNNRNSFFYRQYEKVQKRYAYLNWFLAKIKIYNNIYIYGAGRVATNTLLKLYQRKLTVKSLIVSDDGNNPNELMDIPVTSIKNSNIDKEKDVILIAVSEVAQYEILYQLQTIGYKNLIILTEDLKQALALADS